MVGHNFLCAYQVPSPSIDIGWRDLSEKELKQSDILLQLVCILYTVYCVLYAVYCVLYTVYRTLYNV
jgi:hypothetical protein